MTREAMLYNNKFDSDVQCYLCNHRCRIKPDQFGVCGVRQNIDGVLFSLVYGDIIARHIDPIEKKPLYHFLPGSGSYSIATMGCNFKCDFCQNWQISQSTKEKKSSFRTTIKTTPDEIVADAVRNKCASIAYTYTEPTIYFEFAYDTAILAKKAGLTNVFVTNGFMTPETLEMIEPFLDAANVDLKSFNNDFYKKICKGQLQPVLESIRLMKKMGIWVEITTLVVPELNDTDEELNKIAAFIAETGIDIPWHVNRFHPDYTYKDSYPTPIETLKKAHEIGIKHGLRYIYLGNVAGRTDTFCYNCHELLVSRSYFGSRTRFKENGTCPNCGVIADGVWG